MIKYSQDSLKYKHEEILIWQWDPVQKKKPAKEKNIVGANEYCVTSKWQGNKGESYVLA